MTQKNTPINSNIVAYPQWPLMLSAFCLFFFLSVLSLVQGAHLWYGEGNLPRIIGWATASVVGIIGFAIWIAKRKTFQLKKRWSLLFPIAFIGGILTGLVFTRFIGSWQELTHLEFREQQNNTLIQTSKNWKSGVVWDESTCTQVSKQQDKYVEQMRAFHRMPFISEVVVLFGTVQTSYQAGCDANWEPLIAALKKPNPQWEHTTTQMQKGFNDFLIAQKPLNGAGCKMEQARIVGQNQKTLSAMMNLVCQEAFPKSRWIPGANIQQAQNLIQALKRRDEAKQQ